MPNNGQSERLGYETLIYLGYDNSGIYVAGQFNDPNPSQIPVGFSQRDNIWEVNADSFWLSINTNDDNLNDQGFQITSAGTLGILIPQVNSLLMIGTLILFLKEKYQ